MREAALSPRAGRPAKPWSPLQSAWRHRRLIWQLTRRDIAKRYKGSVLGIVWSFIYPLMLLAVYTFVFRIIFVSRWNEDGSNLEFALVLFAGLIVYNLFAESLAASPTLISGHAPYVKKVVFPLETLAWVVIGNALFHAGASLCVLAVGLFFFGGGPPWTIILLPLVFVPLILLTLGLVWLLSSLGVYLRDVDQIVGVALVLLMFMSPILYPVSAIPESLRPFLVLNPLAPILELARDVAIYGRSLEPLHWLGATVTGWLVAWFGFWWFQKTRNGFADVI